MTERTKHTPGPWHHYHHGGPLHVVMDKYGDVAVVKPHGHEDETAANARLIAAAPEMLEDILDAHDHALKATAGAHDLEDAEVLDLIVGILSRTIAKAEGRDA